MKRLPPHSSKSFLSQTVSPPALSLSLLLICCWAFHSKLSESLDSPSVDFIPVSESSSLNLSPLSVSSFRWHSSLSASCFQCFTSGALHVGFLCFRADCVSVSRFKVSMRALVQAWLALLIFVFWNEELLKLPDFSVMSPPWSWTYWSGSIAQQRPSSSLFPCEKSWSPHLSFKVLLCLHTLLVHVSPGNKGRIFLFPQGREMTVEIADLSISLSNLLFCSALLPSGGQSSNSPLSLSDRQLPLNVLHFIQLLPSITSLRLPVPQDYSPCCGPRLFSTSFFQFSSVFLFSLWTWAQKCTFFIFTERLYFSLQ